MAATVATFAARMAIIDSSKSCAANNERKPWMPGSRPRHDGCGAVRSLHKQRHGLVRQHAAGDRDGGEGRLGGDVGAREHDLVDLGGELRNRRRENEPPHMAPEDRAHAHRTRFAGGVERAAAQRRAAVIGEAAPATISPCAVGSSVVRPKLRPRAMTAPSRTITAPKGKSAWRASSSAMRMNRISSTEAGPPACACTPVGAMAAAASPARKKRLLGAWIARWHAQGLYMSTSRQALDHTLAAAGAISARI